MEATAEGRLISQDSSIPTYYFDGVSVNPLPTFIIRQIRPGLLWSYQAELSKLAILPSTLLHQRSFIANHETRWRPVAEPQERVRDDTQGALQVPHGPFNHRNAISEDFSLNRPYALNPLIGVRCKSCLNSVLLRKALIYVRHYLRPIADDSRPDVVRWKWPYTQEVKSLDRLIKRRVGTTSFNFQMKFLDGDRLLRVGRDLPIK